MTALLRDVGIKPWVRDWENINLSVVASSAVQFIGRE